MPLVLRVLPGQQAPRVSGANPEPTVRLAQSVRLALAGRQVLRVQTGLLVLRVLRGSPVLKAREGTPDPPERRERQARPGRAGRWDPRASRVPLGRMVLQVPLDLAVSRERPANAVPRGCGGQPGQTAAPAPQARRDHRANAESRGRLGLLAQWGLRESGGLQGQPGLRDLRANLVRSESLVLPARRDLLGQMGPQVPPAPPGAVSPAWGKPPAA